MTELSGKITIEKRGYQAEASITSEKCSKHTTRNGIQQRKSVAMMIEILVCNLRSLFRFLEVLETTSPEDLVT